jgi:hypothetical protein
MVGVELGRAVALFVERGEQRAFRLPFACEERCQVGSHFCIIPLLSWLRDDAPFYVLAVSQNEVRFFRGTRGEMEPIAVPGLPANREEAVRLDDAEPGIQAHSARPYLGRTKEGMAFHGHGGAPDAAKDLIAEYFREIDRALSATLPRATEPLIFAGVDYLFPIYQEANTYPHLVAKPVAGNPELWSADELRERVWPIVESLVREDREVELAKYGNRISQNRTSDRLEEILLAAYAGAVEILFLDPAARCTGAFQPEQQAVLVDERPESGSEDLMNLAATLVLRNKGTVQPLGSDDVPGGGPMAAVLRYPFPAARISAAAAGR